MSVVFITGGCVNTGLAIANLFASKGWDVAVSSRDIASSTATVEMLKENKQTLIDIANALYEKEILTWQEIKSIAKNIAP